MSFFENSFRDRAISFTCNLPLPDEPSKNSVIVLLDPLRPYNDEARSWTAGYVIIICPITITLYLAIFFVLSRLSRCATSFCTSFPAYRAARLIGERAKLFSTTNQFSWFIEFALAGVCVLSRDFAEHIVSRGGCRCCVLFLINALRGPGALSRALMRKNRRYISHRLRNFRAKIYSRASKVLHARSQSYICRGIFTISKPDVAINDRGTLRVTSGVTHYEWSEGPKEKAICKRIFFT